jgi:hypothetical protein
VEVVQVLLSPDFRKLVSYPIRYRITIRLMTSFCR